MFCRVARAFSKIILSKSIKKMSLCYKGKFTLSCCRGEKKQCPESMRYHSSTTDTHNCGADNYLCKHLQEFY